MRLSDLDRDPRIDPKPGDVLKGKRVEGCGNSVVFSVTVAGLHHVSFNHGTGRWGRFMTRSAWRKWAATATVIRRSEEANG